MEFYIFIYSPVPVQMVYDEKGFFRVLVTGLLACTVVFWSWLVGTGWIKGPTWHKS